MATAKGSNVQLMLIEESTWGTTPGTPSGYVIPISGVGVAFSRNLIDDPELRGDRNPAAPVKGNVTVTGDITHPIHLDACGWLIQHGVSTLVTTGTGPYTHTAKVGSSIPTGLSLEVGYTDISQYELHAGCRISSLKFMATPEGVASMTASVIGKNTTASGSSADGSPTSYTSTAESEFVGSIKEGGSTSAIVTDVQLTLDNGLDDSMYVVGGAGLRADLPEGAAKVSGSLTALFQDLTLYNKALNHTESSLELAWTNGTSSLTITVPELVYAPASPTISGPAGVKVTLNFQGYYANDAGATALKAVLVNDTASY